MRNAAALSTALLLSCVCLSACATVPEKMRSALAESQFDEAIQSGDEYLAGKPDEHFREVMVLLDEACYRRAAALGTMESYQAYVLRFPTGHYRAEAMERREHLLFESIRTAQDTPEGYRRFLKEYPSGKHSAEAKDRILELDWKAAQWRKTLEAVLEFRKLYPNSRFDAQALELEAELTWEALQLSPKSQLLLDFAAHYQNSPHVAAARQQAEDLDWAFLESSPSVTGFARFLRTYPESSRGSLAQTKLGQYTWAERIAGEVADGASSDEMLVVCGNGGTAVLNPYTGARLVLSTQPVAYCQYSPKGQFVVSSVILPELSDNGERLLVLEVQDLTTNAVPVAISSPTRDPLCLMGVANGDCDDSRGFLGKSGFGKGPKGKTVSMVGLLETDSYLNSLAEQGAPAVDKAGLKKVKLQNLDQVALLLERLSFTSEPRLYAYEAGSVQVENRASSGAVRGAFLSPSTIVLVPGGKALLHVVSGRYDQRYSLYDLSTQQLLSVDSPQTKDTALTDKIQIASKIVVSNNGQSYIADGCWHDFSGAHKVCEDGISWFYGGNAAVDVYHGPVVGIPYATYGASVGGQTLCTPETKGRWVRLPDLPERSGAGCAVYYKGQVFVFGGASRDGEQFPPANPSVYSFDLATRRWTYEPPMPQGVWGGTCQVLGSKVYLFGGRVTAGQGSANSAVTQVFDLQKRSWSTAPALQKERGWLGSAVADGRIWAIGGVGADYSNTTEVLAPGSNWTLLPSAMNGGRYGLGAGTYKGRIFAIGGDRWDGNRQLVFDSIEVMTPSDKQWKTVGRLPQPATFIATAFFEDGELFLLHSGKLWKMDPTTYSVTALDSLPQGVGAFDSAITTTPEGIFAGGSGGGPGPHSNKAYLYCR